MHLSAGLLKHHGLLKASLEQFRIGQAARLKLLSLQWSASPKSLSIFRMADRPHCEYWQCLLNKY